MLWVALGTVGKWLMGDSPRPPVESTADSPQLPLSLLLGSDRANAQKTQIRANKGYHMCHHEESRARVSGPGLAWPLLAL